MILGIFALAALVVVSATQLIALRMALKDVSEDKREGVLRGLAECFRWWRRGSGRGARGS